jgi:hypothetical protein
LETFLGLAKVGNKGDPMKNLEDRRSLKVLHDATVLGEVRVSKTPAGSTVVDRDATSGVKDTAKTALPGVGNVQELANVADSIEWDVSKGLVLENLAAVVASELWILVNVVGVGVMLFVHDTFVLPKLKAKDTRIKETEVIDPLGLEGIPVEELMLSSKSKALKLESVKEVERKEHQELSKSKALFVQGEDLLLLYTVDGRGHD